jgi:hypothetical protein
MMSRLTRFALAALCLLGPTVTVPAQGTRDDVDFLIQIPYSVERTDGTLGWNRLAFLPNATVSTFLPEMVRSWSFIVLGDGNVGIRVTRYTTAGTDLRIEHGFVFSDGSEAGFERSDQGSRDAQPYSIWAQLGDGDYWYPAVVSGDVASTPATGLGTFWNVLPASLQTTFALQMQYLQWTPSAANPTGRQVVAKVTPVGPNPQAVTELLRGGSHAIGGVVWDDFNLNGRRDPGERGLGGVLLRLHKGTYAVSEIVQWTSTASDGTYQFAFSEDGQYFVEMNQPLDTRPATTNPPSETVVFSQIGGLPHNDADRSDPWETTLTSAVLEILPSTPDQQVNAGLTFLPVLTFNPNYMALREPTATAQETVNVGVVASRSWDGPLTLSYDFTVPSEEVVFGVDYQFPAGSFLSADRAGAAIIDEFLIFRDNREEYGESVIISLDLDAESEISSRSGSLTISLLDPETPSVEVPNSIISELYVGFLGAGEDSPAILMRGENTDRLGAFVKAAETAFFANLQSSAGGYTFSSDGLQGRGDFVNNAFEGSMSYAGSFRLERVDPFGPFANSAGLYVQEGVFDEDWDVYAVLTPQGELLFYSEYEGEGTGGGLTVPASGSLKVGLPGGSRFEGTVPHNAPYQIVGILTEEGEKYPLFLTRIAALAPDETGVLSFMLAGATTASGGWANQPWFGWFQIRDLNNRWVYHQEWGYLWMANDSFANFWVYSLKHQEWMLTSPTSYPYLYSAKVGGWLFYLLGTEGNWIYDYTIGDWRPVGG